MSKIPHLAAAARLVALLEGLPHGYRRFPDPWRPDAEVETAHVRAPLQGAIADRICANLLIPDVSRGEEKPPEGLSVLTRRSRIRRQSMPALISVDTS